MKEIKLTQGRVAIVDDEDYERVSQYIWHFKADHKNKSVGYACAHDKDKILRLHIFILGMKHVDHKNNNRLDCRKENLRPATPREQARNMLKKSGTTSIWKGVSWEESSQKWRARIQINGRNKYLGRFAFEYDAAQAYNFAAEEYFGEFAKLNSPMIKL